MSQFGTGAFQPPAEQGAYEQAIEVVNTIANTTAKKLKVAAHWGLIPLIIFLGTSFPFFDQWSRFPRIFFKRHEHRSRTQHCPTSHARLNSEGNHNTIQLRYVILSPRSSLW